MVSTENIIAAIEIAIIIIEESYLTYLLNINKRV